MNTSHQDTGFFTSLGELINQCIEELKYTTVYILYAPCALHYYFFMQGAIALLAVILGYWVYQKWNRYTWDAGAPWEGMPPDVVEHVVKLAKVGYNDIFYELGSGDGRVVIAAAMSGADAYGVEIDKFRALYSKLWIWLLRLSKNAKIINADVFKTDLSKATVVCCYLLPETHEKLKKKLKRELKKGTKVVAVGFEIEGWKPIAVDPRGPVYGPIYLYKI